MKTSEFHFDFPEELVAQVPLAERDSARLLFWDPVAGQPRDRIFSELPNVLREKFPATVHPSVLLIVNDSKVYPARMRCMRQSGGRCEVFVLSTRSETEIPCLLRPLKKLRVGEVLLGEETGQPVFSVRSVEPPLVDNVSGMPLRELLTQRGEMPLPPYIERDPQKARDPSLAALDRLRYQTVYARDEGSSAAPTAGLHFTPSVLEGCAHNGIKIAPVTLHVGLGTFQPVVTSEIDDHDMHHEICSVPAGTMDALIEHIDNGWPVVFVGTTALRCVESVLLHAFGFDLVTAGQESRSPLSEHWNQNKADWTKKMQSAADVWISTNLFIRPSARSFLYRTLCGHGIITNFHQPESTLTMLISALLNYDAWRSIYRHAVDARYRLFSYGDSSLLLFPEKL
ncbi:MAG: hypothetical protein RIR26_2264 [Pseudomonadota bacterium]|jgi:S-adenosylmethionine:tRNA ribosyltransferase-isomerase